MGSRVVACGVLFGMRFVRFYLFIYLFLNLCMGCRLWGFIWDEICQKFFFPEFVYGLSHVGLYLGWDLSHFIYYCFFF
jgi:hypothetical protein